MSEREIARITAAVVALIEPLSEDDRMAIIDSLPYCLFCGASEKPNDFCGCMNDD